MTKGNESASWSDDEMGPYRLLVLLPLPMTRALNMRGDMVPSDLLLLLTGPFSINRALVKRRRRSSAANLREHIM